MDAVKMLHDFAQQNGIEKEKVNRYLAQFNEPKTLKDVLNLPYDLQKHTVYITWLGEPLQSFIMEEWYDGERYTALKAEELIDFLLNRVHDNELVDEDIDLETADWDILEAINEEAKEKFEHYKKIAKAIINTKFGSVKIDW